MKNNIHKKLYRNIKIIYWLAFFYSFGVIVPFFMSKGLSLTEIFYLQAIFAAAIVVFEAPSGYFADVLGRKIALIIDSIAQGLAYLYLNYADGLASLIISEIMAGIAASLFLRSRPSITV